MADSAVQDDSVDFKAVLNRFVALNQVRLRRTYGALRPRQAEFLRLLPLIFHVNDPALPGHCSAETPAGITGYEPDATALEAARRYGAGVTGARDAHRQARLRAIYCMGSPGSVAYSGESDFDIWICHDPKLDPHGLRLLSEKAEAVRQWAESLDLEVHFFLVNPVKYRRGEIDRLGSESCGSTQHRLLLDEFYRTGLHLAGMYPMWWFVPPEHETDYEAYVGRLKHRRAIQGGSLLDLGGVGSVPAEEFLGAAIWQLSKGIDSPYKSVLKLLLIEAYAREYPALDLLSVQFKRAVYAGQEDIDRLDPYLMMLDKVEAFLLERNDTARLALARRCFYLKVDENLTRTGAVAQWRRTLLERRVRDWNWSRDDLQAMDSRDNWKIHQVTEERRILFDALSASYRFLSDFARRHAQSALITREDLTILGRKLYAAFERKAGKIELVGRGIAESLVESRLALHEVSDEQQRSVWVLYRGDTKPEEAGRHTALKRTRTIVQMVAWCYFNRVLDLTTVVSVYARESHFDRRQLQAMVARMVELFLGGPGEGGSMADFAGPARTRRCVAFVNTGEEPLACEAPPRGDVSGGRPDPLSCGAAQESLVRSIDLVITTSWREVLTFHYTDSQGVLDCLCEFLKWTPPGSTALPGETVAASTAPGQTTVARRMQELFDDLAACFYGGEHPPETRYILRVGRIWYALYFEGVQPRYDRIGGQEALLLYLGASQPVFRPVVFDRHALDEPLLALIYSANCPGRVQFFYRDLGGELELYVLDERGSLFFRRMGYYRVETLLSHYARFFDAVFNRMNFLMQEGQSLQAPEGLEFYAVRAEAGRMSLQREGPQVEAAQGPYLSLQVIMDVDDEGNTTFTLYCNGREFSSLEMGNGVFEATVNHVLELRQSGQRYPVYITDISMSPSIIGQESLGKIQTVNFLAYKARIEEKLDNALYGAAPV